MLGIAAACLLPTPATVLPACASCPCLLLGKQESFSSVSGFLIVSVFLNRKNWKKNPVLVRKPNKSVVRETEVPHPPVITENPSGLTSKDRDGQGVLPQLGRVHFTPLFQELLAQSPPRGCRALIPKPSAKWTLDSGLEMKWKNELNWI